MKLVWPNDMSFLKLPLQNGAKRRSAEFAVGGSAVTRRRLPLAESQIDAWLVLEREWLSAGGACEIILEDGAGMAGAASFFNDGQMVLPVIPCGARGADGRPALRKTPSGWELRYSAFLLGEGANECEEITLRSDDLMFWERGGVTICAPLAAASKADSTPVWKGDVRAETSARDERGDMSLAFLSADAGLAIRRDILGMPVCLENGAPGFAGACRNYRVFERRFDAPELPFHEELAFRVMPLNWPDIRLMPAQYTSGDITAEAFEADMRLSVSPGAEIRLELLGYHIAVSETAVRKETYAIAPAKDENGHLHVHVTATEDFLQVLGANEVLLIARRPENELREEAVSPVTSNIADCALPPRRIKTIQLAASGDACIKQMTLYGLRLPRWSDEAAAALGAEPKKGALLFSAPHYRVFENCVEDDRYGPPAAFALSGNLVLSPQRVCEEFQWRDNEFGDMVRSVNRTDIWRPSFPEGRYPSLESGIPALDAAYNIALDTFALCSDTRFSLSGQEGLWSNGLFQGEGQGFGVWLRDTAHVAMRCGSLIDPARARCSLLYTMKKGFDNGSDGPAMASVGMWDYAKATGDLSAVYEAWPDLVKSGDAIEQRYDETRSLVRAPMSTSNDCFPEVDNNGFALGSETYYMLAYDSLAKMSALIGGDPARTAHWRARADAMRGAIRAQYWNGDCGYFAAGPAGSPAFQRGIWEGSGVESAVWSRFSIASAEQSASVLKKLRDISLTEYGITLFPHETRVNHFTGSVWGVWQAGFASAAAKQGDVALVEQLLYGQVRNALINKTFYEIVNDQTGIAWRWPGQLWHAAGFLSLVYYGVLGMDYDESGMTFCPAVPAPLSGLRLSGLRYRDAVLDIELAGAGTGHRLLLDGGPVEAVPAAINGRHTVSLVPSAS